MTAECHELSRRKDGTHEMFSLRETPWHKLGKVLEAEITDDQVLVEAGLNWEVLQEEVFAANNHEGADGAFQAIPGFKVLKRSDTGFPLSIVGERYRVFQNHEMVKAMRLIAKDLHVVWETAGALRGGQIVWTMGYMPDLVYNVKNDAIKTYMLITNGHGNAKSLMLTPTTIRVVCRNTLRMATAGNEAERLRRATEGDYSDVALSEGFSIRHNGSLDAILAGVVGAYSDIVKDAESTKAVSEALADKDMARKDSQAYWRTVFGLEAPAGLDEAERVKAMRRETKIITKLDSIMDSPTCAAPEIKDTLWAALQACTEYVDHHDVSDTSSAARRFQTANFGTGLQLKQKAWDSALELLGA